MNPEEQPENRKTRTSGPEYTPEHPPDSRDDRDDQDSHSLHRHVTSRRDERQPDEEQRPKQTTRC